MRHGDERDSFREGDESVREVNVNYDSGPLNVLFNVECASACTEHLAQSFFVPNQRHVMV